ncbi:dihydrolipoyl dehydrogenase [Thiocapsa marina]|uniref:Dihydrolipoyl dehydrogenase n=1 Tax=Thiocapsa marina 5811 TaxID=768671 RepID=F9U9Q5_9GAMM|nr:dihydrolipoyl dehydrogenase [Thiocapsa marina]EGV18853.1 Dihydrolipoyl dehydrogenase [Thiocapsa marina 5811]
MKQVFDVAIIGAGHAGLNAVKEVRKLTDNWVLINGGPLGTTCARIGCMPSKVAIHLADNFQSRRRFERYGIHGADALALDQTSALEHVRDLRDTFVDLVLANTTDEMDDEHLLEGYAEFIDAGRLRVGDREIRADSVIIATGAKSMVPSPWQERFGDGILTVDTLFEQESLPKSVAVIGLGPIGVEIGQAMHRLGVDVTGIDHGKQLSRIPDPEVNRAAIDILQREFPVWLGHESRIERCDAGFRVYSGERVAEVEKLFLAVGRHPHLGPLRLERLNVPLDPHGVPMHDPETLRIGRLPVYLAGDSAGGIASLQMAAEQGRIAGYNAVHRRPRRLARKTPMAILFTDPNIALVGQRWDTLDHDRTAVALQRFGPVGRALIMGQNRGVLRVYADRRSHRILGAAMIGPRCEHLAHLLAWAIECRLTVERTLEMPFYHPVIEEALQDALLELDKELSTRRQPKRFALFGRRTATPTPAGA